MKTHMILLLSLLLQLSRFSAANAQVLELPFHWVWRIEVRPEMDRMPNTPEILGVADATTLWLTGILVDAVLPSPMRLQEVSTSVTESAWDPDKASYPHTVQLACQVNLEADPSSSVPIPDIDIRQLLSDNVNRDSLTRFVSEYLRSSGPSSSVFQYSLTTATYLLQVTTTDRDASPPTSVTPDHINSTSTTDVYEPPTAVNTTSSSMPPEAELQITDSVAFSTTPVVLSYGIPSTADQVPTAEELTALQETTESFLQTQLEMHYTAEEESETEFLQVSLEWTNTDLADDTGLSHVLGADILIGYAHQLPTDWMNYYVFLLSDIFQANQADYVLNHVRQSGPPDSIFRSVTQFAFDFRL